jgi:hypothetical protein
LISRLALNILALTCNGVARERGREREKQTKERKKESKKERERERCIDLI